MTIPFPVAPSPDEVALLRQMLAVAIAKLGGELTFTPDDLVGMRQNPSLEYHTTSTRTKVRVAGTE